MLISKHLQNALILFYRRGSKCLLEDRFLRFVRIFGYVFPVLYLSNSVFLFIVFKHFLDLGWVSHLRRVFSVKKFFNFCNVIYVLLCNYLLRDALFIFKPLLLFWVDKDLTVFKIKRIDVFWRFWRLLLDIFYHDLFLWFGLLWIILLIWSFIRIKTYNLNFFWRFLKHEFLPILLHLLSLFIIFLVLFFLFLFNNFFLFFLFSLLLSNSLIFLFLLFLHIFNREGNASAKENHRTSSNVINPYGRRGNNQTFSTGVKPIAVRNPYKKTTTINHCSTSLQDNIYKKVVRASVFDYLTRDQDDGRETILTRSFILVSFSP